MDFFMSFLVFLAFALPAAVIVLLVVWLCVYIVRRIQRTMAS